MKSPVFDAIGRARTETRSPRTPPSKWSLHSVRTLRAKQALSKPRRMQRTPGFTSQRSEECPLVRRATRLRQVCCERVDRVTYAQGGGLSVLKDFMRETIFKLSNVSQRRGYNTQLTTIVGQMTTTRSLVLHRASHPFRWSGERRHRMTDVFFRSPLVSCGRRP